MSENYVSSDSIRSAFSKAMSLMYREEVPAYGLLMDLVAEVNAETLAGDPALAARLEASDGLERISEERHGAIRLGTAAELTMMRRVFAVMGMEPVGYYDLSVAGVPVHSTAFRPVGAGALSRNPFRVFTSLLRLDLIGEQALRAEAAAVLEARRIFPPKAVALTERAEAMGGLNALEAEAFVREVLETFRWHQRANVDLALYHRLHDAHRLIADVVSFTGPHINHLTPRTLDIDAVQARMPLHGIAPKAVIEGPPRRDCPILLRQTSFKALEETVWFKAGEAWSKGSHTARFGEIEQRGIALTPKGRALYDTLLDEARKRVRPAADGSNADDYMRALREVFAAFPDDWDEIRAAGLGYFQWHLSETGKAYRGGTLGAQEAEAMGLIIASPVIYEDFLPVSAAGIFQSNLGDGAQQAFEASPNQRRFEADLGTQVLDEFAHYEGIQNASLGQCLAALNRSAA